MQPILLLKTSIVNLGKIILKIWPPTQHPIFAIILIPGSWATFLNLYQTIFPIQDCLKAGSHYNANLLRPATDSSVSAGRQEITIYAASQSTVTVTATSDQHERALNFHTITFQKIGQPRTVFRLFSVFSNRHHFNFCSKCI